MLNHQGRSEPCKTLPSDPETLVNAVIPKLSVGSATIYKWNPPSKMQLGDLVELIERIHLLSQDIS